MFTALVIIGLPLVMIYIFFKPFTELPPSENQPQMWCLMLKHNTNTSDKQAASFTVEHNRV